MSTEGFNIEDGFAEMKRMESEGVPIDHLADSLLRPDATSEEVIDSYEGEREHLEKEVVFLKQYLAECTEYNHLIESQPTATPEGSFADAHDSTISQETWTKSYPRIAQLESTLEEKARITGIPFSDVTQLNQKIAFLEKQVFAIKEKEWVAKNDPQAN